MTSNKVCMGVDLGTTYCSVSFYDPQKEDCELVKENDETSSFPSYVNITGKVNISAQCGPVARNAGGVYMLYDSKRLIGKTYEEYDKMGDETDGWKFQVEDDGNGGCLMVINNPLDKSKTEKFYPEEVSGLLLNWLKTLAKHRFGHKQIGFTIVTIPVKFTAAQRDATLRACKLAGLENVELMHEPSASVVEYKRYIEKYGKGTLQEGMKILVFDFGGGTFDVCTCVIQRKPNGETNVQVIETGGDQDLGGKNFDRLMMEIVLEGIEDEFPDAVGDLTINRRDANAIKIKKRNGIWKMLVECEKAKIELSKRPDASVPLGKILGEDYEDETIGITRKEFEEKCLASGLLERVEKCVDKVLKDTNWKREDIDLVLPIGGTCNIPIVRATIDRLFPDMRKRADPLFDPLSAVSKGAAYYAYSCSATNGSILEDRLSDGIGIKLSNGDISYLAKKGDPLPHTKEDIFTVSEDGKMFMVYDLYSGNGKQYNDKGMKFLSKMTISLPLNVKMNAFKMKVKLIVSRSGLIEFDVQQLSNGKHMGTLQTKLSLTKKEYEINDMKEHLKPLITIQSDQK